MQSSDTGAVSATVKVVRTSAEYAAAAQSGEPVHIVLAAHISFQGEGDVGNTSVVEAAGGALPIRLSSSVRSIMVRSLCFSTRCLSN